MTAKAVRCVWCEEELAPEDAKPIKYARLPSAPDEENMQCRDEAACQQRQDRIDAVLNARLQAKGLGFLFGAGTSAPRAGERNEP
jgi:hypothetical protein